MAETGQAGRMRRNRCTRRINEQLIDFGVAVFVLLGVDAIDWTGVHTGGVLVPIQGSAMTYAICDFSGETSSRR